MGLGFLARRRGLLKREGEGSGWRGGSTLLVAVLLSDTDEKQRKGKKGVADARARDGRGGGKLQRGGAGRFHAGWTAWQGPDGLDLFGQKKREGKGPLPFEKKQ